MPLVRLNLHPSPRQVRSFALAFLPAFLLATAAIAALRHQRPLVVAALAGAAAASVIAGLLWPAALRALFVGLTVVTYPLAWLVSNVLLAAVYFLVFTPAGLVARLLGYDPLRRRRRGQENAWVARPEEAGHERYFRQY